MKKLLFALSLALFLFSSIGSSYAQSKRELKKEQREQELQVKNEALDAAIEADEFQFTAKMLVSTGKAAFSSVRLTGLWDVTVTPARFSCMLPIYGMSGPTGRPTLLRNLRIFTGDFEITKEKNKKGNWEITIKASDDVGSRRYTFKINSSTNGGDTSILYVTTDFDAPVQFSGSLE